MDTDDDDDTVNMFTMSSFVREIVFRMISLDKITAKFSYNPTGSFSSRKSTCMQHALYEN